MNYYFFILYLVFFLSSCQTTQQSKPNPRQFDAVKLTMQTSDQVAIEIAAERGGAHIDFVSKLLSKRNTWAKVAPSIENRIEANKRYSEVERFNLAKLYQTKPGPISTSLVDHLLSHKNTFFNKIGWYLAAARPSPKVAQMVDKKLTNILEDTDGTALHDPMVAAAISSNQLVSAYSILRRSLFDTGIEQFAEAMITLNPSQASEDFLDYLAIAPVEELRQLTIKSVNTMTCRVILNHLQKYPPEAQNPKFNTLFVYAVARNRVLSDLAAGVLEVSMVKNRRYIAALLARSSEWLQIAFVENARHDMTAQQKLFLNDLRRITPHEDVVYEINASIR